MNTVKVKREDLLTKVRANRDAHRELFLKAQANYRKFIIEELDWMLADAKAGRQIRRSIDLVQPRDHTGDYDRTIMMLEMSVDDTITLDAGSFDCYVMDNWAWSRFALHTNTAYAAETPSAPGKWREQPAIAVCHNPTRNKRHGGYFQPQRSNASRRPMCGLNWSGPGDRGSSSGRLTGPDGNRGTPSLCLQS